MHELRMPMRSRAGSASDPPPYEIADSSVGRCRQCGMSSARAAFRVPEDSPNENGMFYTTGRPFPTIANKQGRFDMHRTFAGFLFVAAFAAHGVAQQPPPLPPAVGNAVLLATNSIQVDRNVVVTRGDLVVNNASAGPVLGEKDLSLDAGVKTPAGFALKANSIDVDGGAVADGDVYFNLLQNNGAINGAINTPLS